MESTFTTYFLSRQGRAIGLSRRCSQPADSIYPPPRYVHNPTCAFEVGLQSDIWDRLSTVDNRSHIVLQANQYYLPHYHSTNVHRSVNYVLDLYISRDDRRQPEAPEVCDYLNSWPAF